MSSMVSRWLLVGYSLVTRWLLITIKHSQVLVLKKSGVLHIMTLIHHTHFSQSVKWHNLVITTLKHAIYTPNVFLKIAGKPNNYQFYLSKFLKFCDNISHKLLTPSQFLEEFIEILGLSALQK